MVNAGASSHKICVDETGYNMWSRGPAGPRRRAYGRQCGTHWCGFDPRQQKVVFGVILVPQSNTIMCKHNIIQTRRVYKLNVYMKPGCPFTIINKQLRCTMQSTRHSLENLAIHDLSEQLDLPCGRSMWCSFETA